MDDLDQLAALLELAPGTIDIILLDNMTPDVLREAVGMRDEHAPDVLLEASGGITLESIPEIAATGIDRISIGVKVTPFLTENGQITQPVTLWVDL